MQVLRSGPAISVANITRQGLTSIALLVALLWTCVIGEWLTLSRANAGAAQAVHEMRELQWKNRRQPANARPVRARAHRAVKVG